MREEKEAIRTHYNADPLKEWNRLQKRTSMKSILRRACWNGISGRETPFWISAAAPAFAAALF